jgi:hypothetical protein
MNAKIGLNKIYTTQYGVTYNEFNQKLYCELICFPKNHTENTK